MGTCERFLLNKMCTQFLVIFIPSSHQCLTHWSTLPKLISRTKMIRLMTMKSKGPAQQMGRVWSVTTGTWRMGGGMGVMFSLNGPQSAGPSKYLIRHLKKNIAFWEVGRVVASWYFHFITLEQRVISHTCAREHMCTHTRACTHSHSFPASVTWTLSDSAGSFIIVLPFPSRLWSS